jgi:Protein of unknown function (DUF2924)
VEKRSAGADGAPVRALDAELSVLDDLDLDGLRQRWRKLFRASAPPHLPRYLLFRIIAYRLQADVYGDLDRETVRFLDRVAAEWKKRRANGEPRSLKSIPAPNRRPLKPGTLLAREHGGTMHRVVVVPDGYVWNDKTYRTLSEIAGAITCTKWSGPRFFGLRDKGETSAPERASRETP